MTFCKTPKGYIVLVMQNLRNVIKICLQLDWFYVGWPVSQYPFAEIIFRVLTQVCAVPKAIFNLKVWQRYRIKNVQFVMQKPRFSNVVYFLPAFGSCAPQSLVEILILNVFNDKKQKKEKKRNLQQNLANNCFFKFAPKCWSIVLFPG